MTLFMMGDSTMHSNDYFTYPQTGWGQVMPLFVKKGVVVENYAENGRSTKSFIDEGIFDIILSRLQPNDYVICQFGHNDEKQQDPTRYTIPYDTYQKNLDYFAKMVEEKGGHIVFATSITRHKFIDGVCVNTHGDYPAAMIDYCNKSNHTCIDMNTLTLDLYNKLGEEATKKFHMIFPENRYSHYMEGKDDHSHLRYDGAVMIAETFVRNIYKTNDSIKSILLDLDSDVTIDWKMLID